MTSKQFVFSNYLPINQSQIEFINLGTILFLQAFGKPTKSMLISVKVVLAFKIHQIGFVSHILVIIPYIYMVQVGNVSDYFGMF